MIVVIIVFQHRGIKVSLFKIRNTFRTTTCRYLQHFHLHQ
nr:MAG TPA: hypothetical protein [Caudoviricetes sp.]